MAISIFEPKTNHSNIDRPSPIFYYINIGDFSIVWFNVIMFIIGHLLFGQTMILVINGDIHPYTWMYAVCLTIVSAIGATAGVHRLWSHRSYDASLPLKYLLMIGQTMSGQNSIYVWARDHRVHHKWSDTDSDPHNSRRGFFFAHCGYLMTKRHPELLLKSRTLDFSDLKRDQVVKFQFE